MSRRKNKPKPAVDATVGDALETMAEEALDQVDAQAKAPAQRRDDVKPHLRCPCCWNGYGGKAQRRKWQRQVNGPLAQRCYVCDQCGAEWVVDVRVEEKDGIEWVETKTSKVRPGEMNPVDSA